MEFDENNGIEEQNGEAVEIYSRRAVWWFSFFSPIIGGIMLAINLYKVGYKRAITGVILFSVLYYLVSNLISLELVKYYQLSNININIKNIDQATRANCSKFVMILIAINIIGATIMTRLFFKKYFPDDDYYPKSVTGPLLIAFILIILSFMGAGF